MCMAEYQITISCGFMRVTISRCAKKILLLPNIARSNAIYTKVNANEITSNEVLKTCNT